MNTEMQEDQDQQIDDSSADLAAAWDAAEEQADVAEEHTEPEPSASEEVADTGQAAGVAEQPAGADPEPGDVPAAAGGTPDPESTPPVGLPPEAREAWKDTPPAMRAALVKREKDFAQGIQQYAEAAKRDHQMMSVMRPFSQYIAMNGNNPAQAVQTLLSTASQLQMGTPVQRAETVASMIKQFGVDIGTLDNLLVGQAPPQGAQEDTRLQETVQQAIAPYQQQLETLRQQQQFEQQQQQNKVQTDLQQFEQTHEFYKDVKMDMADIMDLATNRGMTLSLDEAYERACKIRPDISAILEARNSTQQITQKRQAASSITGSPGGYNGQAEPDSRYAAIEAAWDNYGKM